MLLDQLNNTAIQRFDCLIVDIRLKAAAVLGKVDSLACTCPILALVDANQNFSDLLESNRKIHDFITIDELGSQLFWLRVHRAIGAFTQPLCVADSGQPISELLQEIVNHSSDWIFVKDLKHRFLLASDSFAQSAGLMVRDLIGKDDLQIGNSPDHVLGNPDKGWMGFWPQDDAVVDSGLMTIEENPHWDLYSNSERYRRTIRVPLSNSRGDIYALLVCSQDITEQRQNEIMLKERTDVLARVIEQKKHAELSQRTAEEAVAAKSRFMAAASHDLRQPLHAMGLFLDALDKRMAGTEDQELVKQIKNSCASLNNLFNSCLDISRLDAGAVECVRENIRVDSFLERLSQEFTRQSAEKDLEFSCQFDDSVIHSDPTLLERILRNLVNNALENTEQGQLSIQGRAMADHIQLRVSDSGIGIPEAEQENIFNEFHQLDSPHARQGKGLGLGLAIVNRLCDLLEIDIHLNSQEGQGSCFTLDIPCGHADQVSPAEQRLVNSSLEGIRVLIIDDDRHIQHGMQVLLSTFGCVVSCATDAASALGLLDDEQQPIDMLVVDYHLAGDDRGSEVIHAIRQKLGMTIPAILVTGDTTMQSEAEARLASLPLLYKPVSAEDLLASISNELAMQEL